MTVFALNGRASGIILIESRIIMRLQHHVMKVVVVNSSRAAYCPKGRVVWPRSGSLILAKVSMVSLTMSG